MDIQELSYEVIGAALEVHKILGPGLLESVYETCLAIELEQRGLAYQRQLSVPILYKGGVVDCNYRLDFLVGGELVLEIKAVEYLLPIHEAQLLTYLRLAKKELGLLINFNAPTLKEGIRRRIMNLPP